MWSTSIMTSYIEGSKFIVSHFLESIQFLQIAIVSLLLITRLLECTCVAVPFEKWKLRLAAIGQRLTLQRNGNALLKILSSKLHQKLGHTESTLVMLPRKPCKYELDLPLSIICFVLVITTTSYSKCILNFITPVCMCFTVHFVPKASLADGCNCMHGQLGRVICRYGAMFEYDSSCQGYSTLPQKSKPVAI